MSDTRREQNNTTLDEAAKHILAKSGSTPFSKDDILILAACELSHTHTYGERGYTGD